MITSGEGCIQKVEKYGEHGGGWLSKNLKRTGRHWRDETVGKRQGEMPGKLKLEKVRGLRFSVPITRASVQIGEEERVIPA